MLIDSGADITLIPEASLDELKSTLNPGESYQVEAFDGQPSVVQSLRLDLVFLGKTFTGRYLIVNSEAGILGRDILNLLALVLDGPRLSWTEQSTGSR
jgi:hypothetical protein